MTWNRNDRATGLLLQMIEEYARNADNEMCHQVHVQNQAIVRSQLSEIMVAARELLRRGDTLVRSDVAGSGEQGVLVRLLSNVSARSSGVDTFIHDATTPTHIALPLSAAAQQQRREAIAQIDPEAYMLNAGYRRGIDTALAALGL